MRVDFEIPKSEEDFSVLSVKNAEVVFDDEKSEWIEVMFYDDRAKKYRNYSIKKEWIKATHNG